MNFIFTFLGWLAWNWFEFTNEKDVADNAAKPFDFGLYFQKKWDNWVWTFIVATCLLFIGHAGLGTELVKEFSDKLEWSDLWYFGSGILSELISFTYRRWFKKQTLTDKV